MGTAATIFDVISSSTEPRSGAEWPVRWHPVPPNAASSWEGQGEDEACGGTTCLRWGSLRILLVEKDLPAPDSPVMMRAWLRGSSCRGSSQRAKGHFARRKWGAHGLSSMMGVLKEPAVAIVTDL
jgi:hypothetical protein